MSKIRAVALSAGLAAGVLSLTAFAPSAFAQYWEGAPNATGPTEEYGPATAPAPVPYWHGPVSNTPNYGGGGPYWLGAPNALGPGA